MSEQDNLRLVREIWAATDHGGVESALELTDPDVEWRPHAASGKVLTSAELLHFFREFQGEREFLQARPYSFHAKGNKVLASGSFRLQGRERFAEFQIHWVSEFEGDKLVRATSFASRREALEAIGMTEDEAKQG